MKPISYKYKNVIGNLEDCFRIIDGTLLKIEYFRLNICKLVEFLAWNLFLKKKQKRNCFLTENRLISKLEWKWVICSA